MTTVENNEAVHDFILSNRLIELKRIAELLRISYERVLHIVNVDLGIKKSTKIGGEASTCENIVTNEIASIMKVTL